MAKQPYTTENPEVRKVDVERVEVDVNEGGRVPAYEGQARVDLSGEVPTVESRAVMDEQVGPDHPAAVIVPPEGRGEHPKLGVDAPTPEDLFASGDADEASAVVDGEVLTGEDAAKREAELRESR